MHSMPTHSTRWWEVRVYMQRARRPHLIDSPLSVLHTLRYRRRRGYADECYTVLVPRHPAASETLISTGVTAVKPAGVLPTASTATAGADGNTVPFNLASQLALPRRATTAAEA